MSAIPIIPNENFGGSVVTSLGAPPETHHQIVERSPFRRHLVLSSVRQDLPYFTLQGPMVCGGTPFETFHHIWIQSPHVNGCHISFSERMIAECFHIVVKPRTPIFKWPATPPVPDSDFAFGFIHVSVRHLVRYPDASSDHLFRSPCPSQEPLRSCRRNWRTADHQAPRRRRCGPGQPGRVVRTGRNGSFAAIARERSTIT